MCNSLYTGVAFTLDIDAATVRPILTYGCEVWASDFIQLIKKPDQLDKAPFEQINNFCKFVLGESSRTSNFAVKAKLGGEPIFAFICSQVIRYWIRILITKTDRILKRAYMSELELHISWRTEPSWEGCIVLV